MSRPGLRLGTALVALYVAVAVATAAWAPGRLRPLFDGFGSHPGLYSWVKPPKEFAEGNRPPDAGQARIAFAAGGSSPVTAETPDGQVMVSLPAGAVPPHQADTAARLDLLPLDSATLGPLPAGLRPESNAYRVTVTYLPSDASVSTAVGSGTVGLTSRVAAETLLFSADGRSWRPFESKPPGGGTALTGPFTEVGYYLAASRGAPRPGTSAGGPPVALFVAAAAVPLVLGYLLLGRRRGGEKPPVRRPGPKPGSRPPPKTTGTAAAKAGSAKTHKAKTRKAKRR